MSDKRKYDATVAIIAGNLLSGLALAPGQVLSKGGGYSDEIEAEYARLAVRRARAIVAEVERTEPEPKA